MEKKWIFAIVFIAILLVVGYIFAGIISVFSGGTDKGNGNIALIHVDGTITTSESSGLFGESIASSTKIVDYINQANDDSRIKAILFEINSPGGSGVASEEISDAIKNTHKPTASYIREVGASGAYWVASSTNRIFASRMSTTGSIGVIASYLEFSGLMKDYNVTYVRLVAGKYKDMGSPYTNLSSEERAILQEQLDTVYNFFIDEVAKNRNLSVGAVSQMATGAPVLGIQAKELGLIDEIGGKDEAAAYLESRINETAQITEYKEKLSFLDLLSQMTSKDFYSMGLGIGNGLKTKEENNLKIMT